MKFIKQVSTNKIVYREIPHSDKTITNAVIDTNIELSDLEVGEENWSESDWERAFFNQKSHSDKRKTEYPPIPEQLDMLWHAIDLDTLDKTSDFYNNLKAVKDKYPKGDN